MRSGTTDRLSLSLFLSFSDIRLSSLPSARAALVLLESSCFCIGALRTLRFLTIRQWSRFIERVSRGSLRNEVTGIHIIPGRQRGKFRAGESPNWPIIFNKNDRRAADRYVRYYAGQKKFWFELRDANDTRKRDSSLTGASLTSRFTFVADIVARKFNDIPSCSSRARRSSPQLTTLENDIIIVRLQFGHVVAVARERRASVRVNVGVPTLESHGVTRIT